MATQLIMGKTGYTDSGCQWWCSNHAALIQCFCHGRRQRTIAARCRVKVGGVGTGQQFNTLATKQANARTIGARQRGYTDGYRRGCLTQIGRIERRGKQLKTRRVCVVVLAGQHQLQPRRAPINQLKQGLALRVTGRRQLEHQEGLGVCVMDQATSEQYGAGVGSLHHHLRLNAGLESFAKGRDIAIDTRARGPCRTPIIAAIAGSDTLHKPSRHRREHVAHQPQTSRQARVVGQARRRRNATYAWAVMGR